MGPMGVNENHGPVRGKATSPPRESSRNERTDFLVNGNHDSHHAREDDDDMQVGDDDEHDEDDDMEGHEENGTNESDEENVDELMDEADFDDAEGSELDASTYHSPAPTSL
jgi:hypothetical protein